MRALIFDSLYDEYRGVIAYVRVKDGAMARGDRLTLMATGASSEALELGHFAPQYVSQQELHEGEIGYVVTGLKDLSQCRVGDTVTLARSPATLPLPGYREVQPMVFASVYPAQSGTFEELRTAISKLKLNDASLTFEPERSSALGFGFRVGVLGLLHLEIMKERLRREFGVEVTVTMPQVIYQVVLQNGERMTLRSVAELPDPSRIAHMEEPWIMVEIIVPSSYLGNVMDLVIGYRGIWYTTKFLDQNRVMMSFEMPMASLLKDFYDKLKSVSSGYASLSYEFLEFRSGALKRLDILLADEVVEPFSTIVEEKGAYAAGKRMVEKLKEVLPRQQFEIKIQARYGGRIIAAERIGARRKDVTGYLYGGDVTRKKKLLEKQKEGKKRMKQVGSVEVPQEAFLAILKK